MKTIARLLMLLALIAVLATPNLLQVSPTFGAARVPVVLVILENHSRSAITASAAPYLTSFAAAGRTFTHYNAVEHPSLPNYLDMTSGSNQGCHNDSCPRQSYSADNIFHQVGDWQAWNESMQSPCKLNSQGLYAVKHNAPPYFADLVSTCAANDIAYPATLPSTLAAFTFATPNLCNDMHSCSVKTGDNWAKSHIPALLAKGAIVIVVFDEGSGSQNVYAAERGPGVASSSDSAAYTHYSLLAGLEDFFGVPRLAHAIGARALPL